MGVVRAKLPGFSGLYIVASHGGRVSATGVSDCPEMAEIRHAAERAERRVATQQGRQTDLAGWAGGRDGAQAVAERARLELIERSAAMRWWRGAAPAAEAPGAAREAFDAAGRAWPRDHPRHEGLAAIGGGATCVLLAWSFDPSGERACIGIAGGEDPGETAYAVRRELCQMEFGRALLDRRAESGCPSPADRDMRRRLDRRDAALQGRLPVVAAGVAAHPAPDGAVRIAAAEADGHVVVRARWADTGESAAALRALYV